MSAVTHIGLAEYHRLVRLIEDASGNGNFVVRRDTSMALETYASIPSPDVFVVDHERWDVSEQTDTYSQGSLQLAIEVFSPGNRPGLMQKKVALNLNAGSSAVWIAYPKRQTVVVHDAEGEREYRMGEHLPVPASLPEGSISIQEIFATN